MKPSKRGRNNKFTCDHCKQTFIRGWTDQDAHAEMAELYPELPDVTPENKHTLGVLCDDCFVEFRAWLLALPQERRNELARQARAEMGVVVN